MQAFARFGTSFSDALSLRSFTLSGGTKRLQITFSPLFVQTSCTTGPDQTPGCHIQVLGGAL